MKLDLSITSLHNKYRDKELSLQEMLDYVLNAIEQTHHYNIWITVLSRKKLLEFIEKLPDQKTDQYPLYGIPFAIKDNIDLVGVPTTAGCEKYAYHPEKTAYAVQRLIDAGAIPIGKTNLDQFATGLVGTRSPYGITPNSFDPDYIAGGSSSGSAVSVARGLVSFSLGTDTAGSGRIPAAFNNLVGVKPTRGLISNSGVVPACRSLDCVSIFALNPDDAELINSLVVNFDQSDPYSRKKRAPKINTTFRAGVLGEAHLAEFSDPEFLELYYQSIEDFKDNGVECIEIDFLPFIEAAKLLYEGPWVAERYVAIRNFIEKNPEALFPVTRDIIEPASTLKTIDAVESYYQLQALKRLADQQLGQVDFILMPTAAAIYKINEVINDPIRLNSNLGYYTNFMNLLDYCAIAIPAGFKKDGLPFGVTLFADRFHDECLLKISKKIMKPLPMGATHFTWKSI